MTAVAPGSAYRFGNSLLPGRRGIPLRLRRGDARGIQGDRRGRAHPPARRPVDRDRLGHDQPRAGGRRLQEIHDGPDRGAEPRAARPAAGPHPLSSVLGQLARPAHDRHPDARHRRGHAGGQCRRLFVRGRQCPPRARMEGVAGRQAARRQADPARCRQPRHQRRRASRNWSPTASCASPIWSAASGSSPRPIAVSAGASIRRSPGPSSKRWHRARHWPAASSGAEQEEARCFTAPIAF